MHVEAIYDHGRLELQTSLKLKHQRFRVRVEIPDQEVADPVTQTPRTYDLAGFSAEVRDRVAQLAAIAEEARQQPLSQAEVDESEEERHRWAAFELRNASRREQGRTP